MFDLIKTSWIPIRRRSGKTEIIRPSQIVENIEADPVVDFDWPRVDFQIASIEFLIGLLATAFPPATERKWRALWRTPPTLEDLEAAFEPIRKAFNLDGPGPRFLQDFEPLSNGNEPIERLLFEAPGEQTIKKNMDLLNHRNRVQRMGRPAAAMALYTMQSWAPSGGKGNRTGLRGGGPLITFVTPSDHDSLWHRCWANVPLGTPPSESDLPKVFPWLAPTLTSEKNLEIQPELNAHPLQAWWGMPRRIRLNFEEQPDARCDITNEPDDIQATGWCQRPYGANYNYWAPRHPLTPTYRPGKDKELLFQHPQPGGIRYRHWLGLVIPTDTSFEAPAIRTWRNDRQPDLDDGDTPRPMDRFFAGGADFDNMKLRSFAESHFPLPRAATPEDQLLVDDMARRLVQASTLVADTLRSTVRAALFSAGATVKLDASLFTCLREEFWNRTEPAFFGHLTRYSQNPTAAQDQTCHDWLADLRRVALDLFDEYAPATPDTDIQECTQIGNSRRWLLSTLYGHSKDGKQLFEFLKQPLPPKAPKKNRTNHAS
ncbi:CRISPR-associated protein Cse1 [Gluconobacter japonicus]|uniref:Type I-E CRISPR-associated protein Cse1/CasA n=1 Tax=Gluconobacter japonicus TaxID=376620 RepID=A0A9Q2FIL9_GLUJA|nr:type I-E CRISPR-associated protein Cse1/CasA [Gluconobacter japonicus]KXV39857.1 CRISPR-associated protein Cse1 [Gluconobacter japonicus]MBF0869859.1 type I-E CRISPR-associated protein Cse1/CasA [Gluconobacter japonicus]